MPEKELIDIAVIVPLAEEVREFLEVFPSIENRTEGIRLQHLVDTGASKLKMLVVLQDAMGRTSAAHTATSVLSSFRVKLIICLGIAGGLHKDVQICDVCYTGQIYDVYDNTKTSDANDGGVTIDFSPVGYRTPQLITATLNFVRSQPDQIGRYEEWQRDRERYATDLIASTGNGDEACSKTIGRPTTLNGAMVCGSVSSSQNYNTQLKGVDRKLLAIETEVGGICSVADVLGVPVLAIRGISDLADKGKGELEAKTKGVIRTIAASNAASFLRLQLGNPYFIQAVHGLGEATQTRMDLNSPDDTNLLPSNILTTIHQDVDINLRELAPEMRVQPAGYQLPPPRAQRRQGLKLQADEDSNQPREVKELIGLHRMIMITIPRNYPDRSLPWVIANELVSEEMGGRQAFPLVVDGARISPPRGTLERESNQLLGKLAGRDGCLPIVIIDNCPLTSKTKLSFFLQQAALYPDARFILLSREDGEGIFNSELAFEADVQLFDLVGISFFQLARFLQKNFSFPSSQAEVVALRLLETFERFKLSAHPSYFAGISSQVLSALIYANRRSELMQLAVDGALSLLVADDAANVTLSRTTRSRYLRQLVCDLQVNGKTHTSETLVAFTQEFAEKFDYDINAIAFIQNFVNHGILHFKEGVLEFSLPYIGTYLLAAELSSDSKAARTYFNIHNEVFDYAAFDLYSEIGASDECIASVMDSLNEAIKSLETSGSADHTVYFIAPTHSTEHNPARLDVMRQRLHKAMDDTLNGTEGSAQKQVILDVNAKARAKVAKLKTDEMKVEIRDEEFDRLKSALRVWSTGTILLGSGAEHLSADMKRKMSALIVKLTALAVAAWMKISAKADFPKVRESLTTDEFLELYLQNLPEGQAKPSTQNLRSQFISAVDLIEYHCLSVPLAILLAHLCEQTRNRVLAKSLEHIKVADGFEKIIYGSWLADITPVSAKRLLISALNAAPSAPLIRQVLANHLLTSAYWRQSDKKDQAALLEASDVALKPTSTPLDKGRAKRLLEARSSGRKALSSP